MKGSLRLLIAGLLIGAPAAGCKNEPPAMLTAVYHQQFAQRLDQARRNAKPLSPLSDDYPQLETVDSYTIQGLLVAEQSAAVGYKLGFTSAAMRVQMGVAEANYSVFLANTLVDSAVPHGTYIHPLTEPEIALVTDKDLGGDGVGLEQAAAAVQWFYPALEIVDSRFENYQFQAVDNIADNSSAAGYCLGSPVAAKQIAQPQGVECQLLKNGDPIARGVGADAMGGPYHALHWLVHKLAENGRQLPAGSMVLTGGFSRAQSAAVGDNFTAEFSGGLGSVDVTFTAN